MGNNGFSMCVNWHCDFTDIFRVDGVGKRSIHEIIRGITRQFNPDGAKKTRRRLIATLGLRNNKERKYDE